MLYKSNQKMPGVHLAANDPDPKRQTDQKDISEDIASESEAAMTEKTEQVKKNINTDDPVDEVVWGSFPASDPPPY